MPAEVAWIVPIPPRRPSAMPSISAYLDKWKHLAASARPAPRAYHPLSVPDQPAFVAAQRLPETQRAPSAYRGLPSAGSAPPALAAPAACTR